MNYKNYKIFQFQLFQICQAIVAKVQDLSMLNAWIWMSLVEAAQSKMDTFITSKV